MVIAGSSETFIIIRLHGVTSRHPRDFNSQILPNALTLLLTHSWSWALLEKLPIVQLLENFPAFYRTRRFITVFTRAIHWSLSWTRSIQSIPPPSYLSKIAHPPTSWYS
jgi:hypothetical protein